MKKRSQIRQLLISLFPVQALAVGLPAINSLLNSFIIGRFLGSEALATMSYILPLDMTVVLISVVLSDGAQIISGNCLGRGDRDNLNKIFNTTSITAFFIGVLVTIITLSIPKAVAGLLGAGGELLPLTVSYIRGIAPGYAFSVLFACFLPFIQLERASKFSTASVVVALIVNCGGNLLNALVLKGGVFGAGLATALANLAAVLVCLFFFLFKSKLFGLSPKHYDFSILRNIVMRGYPSGVPQICTAIKSVLLNKCLFALGGTPALAAMAIANNISNSIGRTVEGGYMGSINLISSVLVGERDVESLRDLPRQGLLTSYPIYLVAYLLVFAFAKPFAMLCGAETENIALYVEIICLVNLWFSTNPVKSMSAALYNALGRHKFITVFHVLNGLIYPSICMFSGLYIFHSVGVTAASFAVSEFFCFFTLIVYYYMCRKRLPDSIFKLTDIPNTLALPSAERYNASFNKIEDVSDVSSGLIQFCKKKGLSSGESNFCGLCVEEMAVASIQNSIDKIKKKKMSIDLRVLHENGGMTIMLRDNGLHFDPAEWLNLCDNEDPMRCIGVKYIIRKAADVHYTSTLGLNVIVIKLRK